MGKAKGKGGKDTRQCYNCGQFGHLAWQCSKGAGKAGNPGAGIKGKGQTWELANVNGGTEDNAQIAGMDDNAPAWQSGNQEDLNLGGTWDNTIGMVTDNDDDWKVVMRKARSSIDMRPRFLPMHSCRDNCLANIERVGNCVNVRQKFMPMHSCRDDCLTINENGDNAVNYDGNITRRPCN